MMFSIARQFSPHPGPRYRKQGRHSGEEFRQDVLLRLLPKCDRLVVDLDGTSGFGSSFLDEAFGGLIRSEGMSKEEVRRRIVIKSDMDSSYLDEVEEAIDLARPH